MADIFSAGRLNKTTRSHFGHKIVLRIDFKKMLRFDSCEVLIHHKISATCANIVRRAAKLKVCEQ